MAECVPERTAPKLSDLFDEIYSSYLALESSADSSSSEAVQSRVQAGIEKCELAVKIVNELSLFTTNENLEEVPTNEIRYMLLPALLGYFSLKHCRGDRLDVVKKAKVYFTDYLRLCRLYKVTDIEVAEPDDEEDESEKSEKSERPVPPSRSLDHAAAARARQAKIDRYKQKKVNERRLQELHSYVSREYVDDEVKREYYTKLLDQWVIVAAEELESIESEIQILEHIAKNHGKDSGDTKLASKGRPLRPFIITKNALQKKVFGLGYPAIPTVTVEEYYRQQVARGVFPGSDAPPPPIVTQEDNEEQQRLDAIAKELLVDRDDEATLRRARDWDDWKDDHRTGWGNTKNMG